MRIGSRDEDQFCQEAVLCKTTACTMIIREEIMHVKDNIRDNSFALCIARWFLHAFQVFAT
jgi:hypothetical protein